MNADKLTSCLLALMLCLVTSAVNASASDKTYSPIQFKSKKIARWQLKTQYRPRSITEAHQYDSSFTYPAGSQSMMSASRQFDTELPQSVYATYKTNNTAFQHYAEWLYLPNDVGTFTRLGWLLGEQQGLNMAVELEHRQVGEEENVALSLGVHYLF
jgi:hypothetical protein